MKKLLLLLLLTVGGGAYAAELIVSAYVNMTSDTSSAAKTMAINDARRQIIIDKLSPYAMSEQLVPAIKDAKNADLINLIAETKIDNEKISDTAYSAKITMTVDKVASRTWMVENNIQNWLNDGLDTDMFVAQITLGDDTIADWADFNRIMRAERIDFTTKYIVGKSVTVELPTPSHASITIALRGAGWRTASSAADELMRVWK